MRLGLGLGLTSALGRVLANLLQNGDFAAATGWVLGNGGGSATIAGGVLTLSGPDAAFPGADQLGVLVAGATYRLRIVTATAAVSGELAIRVGGGTNNGPNVAAAGTYEATVVADGADFKVFRNSGYGGSTVVIDSIALTLMALPAPPPLNTAASWIALHIDSDADTVGERDDASAIALWLGTQDHFRITGFTHSPPDGNVQEYHNLINAYETDRPKLMAATSHPERFQSAAALRAMVRAGVTTDHPARGYRIAGDAGYANAKACADLLIANALAHGNPSSSNPADKLWVAVQGGFTTLAQALYQAIELGECPDILSRIRVLAQPSWNSQRTPNAWAYIFGNCWPVAGTPGIFGGLWMLCGYAQWQGFNRDNGATDTTFWNEVIAGSAMGAHLDLSRTRAGSSYPGQYFRAGDAGIWFWLLSAKRASNFNPVNPANWCGTYRTYVGEAWATTVFGHTNDLDPGGMTYSTTLWAPELTVNNESTAAEAAVNLAKWYEVVAQVFDRYQLGASATTQLDIAPTRHTIWSLTGPALLTEGTAGTFNLHRSGAALSGPATVTFSEAGGAEMTAPVTSPLTVNPADPNPVAISRTATNDGATENGESYTLTISGVSTGAVDRASVTSSLSDASVDITPFLVLEHTFAEGAGSTSQTIVPAVGTLDLIRGATTAVETTDPLWIAEGIQSEGDDYLIANGIASGALFNGIANLTMVAVVYPVSATGDQVICARDNGAGARQFQFRMSSGVLSYVDSRPATAVVLNDTGGAMALNQWNLLVGGYRDGNLFLRRNGVDRGSVATPGGTVSANTSLTALARQASSFANKAASGSRLAYLGFYSDLPLGGLAAAEQRARERVALKGITV